MFFSTCFPHNTFTIGWHTSYLAVTEPFDLPEYKNIQILTHKTPSIQTKLSTVLEVTPPSAKETDDDREPDAARNLMRAGN